MANSTNFTNLTINQRNALLQSNFPELIVLSDQSVKYTYWKCMINSKMSTTVFAREFTDVNKKHTLMNIMTMIEMEESADEIIYIDGTN